MLLRKIAEVALPAKGEYAPGIPANRTIASIPKVKTNPQQWSIATQLHRAERAGEHMDLRLVDPSGKAHSWAVPRGALPKPGEKILAIPQPTHTEEYSARKGTFSIPEGYGKGEVTGSGLSPIEVTRSVPGRLLRFNIYGGRKEGNQEFALINTRKGQLLYNTTSTAETGIRAGHLVPQSRPNYRETAISNVSFDDPNEVHQAKVDGAHATIHLLGNKGVKFFSHRGSKFGTGLLEHTHKLPDFHKLVAPPELDGTVLRGELYGERKGKAIPSSELGGLLNSGVWKSRETQRLSGASIKPVIFDVVRYKGKDMEGAPYADKLKVLEEVQSKVPRLKLPPMARTPKEKADLLSRIESGKMPITDEGIVSWRLDDPRPTKSKFRPDVDAEIVGMTEGKGKHEGRTGALQVKLPGKSAVTNVGTGFSDQLREEIAKDPEKYIGRVAKIKTMQVLPSGRLRAPSFGGFHIEKGEQP